MSKTKENSANTSYLEYGLSIETGSFCCGVKDYGEFCTDIITRGKYSSSTFSNNKTLALKLAEKEFKTIFNPRYISTAYLVQEQNPVWGAVLKKFGFKVKGSFINPNSGNKVYAYIYIPSNKPEKSR